MMKYRDEFLVEHMQSIQLFVKGAMKKLGLPQSEYEDCLQEAYIFIWKQADKFDPDKEFGPFARRVITNGLIDLYKRNRELKKDLLSLDYDVQDEEGNGVELVDLLKGENETENQALQNITVELLHKYIEKSKESCTAASTVKGFEALELKIAGYSGEQIAKMYDVSSNSVRSWMSNARKLLNNEENIAELLKN